MLHLYLQPFTFILHQWHSPATKEKIQDLHENPEDARMINKLGCCMLTSRNPLLQQNKQKAFAWGLIASSSPAEHVQAGGFCKPSLISIYPRSIDPWIFNSFNYLLLCYSLMKWPKGYKREGYSRTLCVWSVKTMAWLSRTFGSGPC